jgi:hypothetical protein
MPNQQRPKIRTTRLTKEVEARMEAYLAANPSRNTYELLASSLEAFLTSQKF